MASDTVVSNAGDSAYQHARSQSHLQDFMVFCDVCGFPLSGLVSDAIQTPIYESLAATYFGMSLPRQRMQQPTCLLICR